MKFPSLKQRYTALDETDEPLKIECNAQCASCRIKKRCIAISTVMLMIVLGVSVPMWWNNYLGRHGQMTDSERIIATNAYSPFLEKQQVHLEEVVLQSALFNKNNRPPSIYREPPSPEVDAAWNELYTGERLYLITAEQVKALGKDPAKIIRAPVNWGMGDDLYLAMNQGQHDIHCLNNIRQFAYSDYYYGNRTAQKEIHFQHCLHTLLQSLQCKYSTDVYTVVWVEGFDNPAVDFNLTRKCQNYDDILRWKPENTYTEDQFISLKPPPDAYFVPAHEW